MGAKTPESTQPVAPPPLESWWGHTGMIYVGVSAFAGAVGFAVSWAVQFQGPWDRLSLSDEVMCVVQADSIYITPIAVVQWLVLRRLVRRVLRAVSGRDLSQTERRFVRNIALWIVVSIAGMVMGGVFRGLILHFALSDQGQFFGELAVGLSLGTAQWIVLRREVSGAGWWIPWTFGGAVLGISPQYLLFFIRDYYSDDSLMIGVSTFAANAAGYAAMQAVCLKHLASEWMKRLHEGAQMAPADVA